MEGDKEKEEKERKEKEREEKEREYKEREKKEIERKKELVLKQQQLVLDIDNLKRTVKELELKNARLRNRISYYNLHKSITNNFVESNVYFGKLEQTYLESKHCILENVFKVKQLKMKVDVKYINDQKIMVVGMQQNEHLDADIVNELTKQTTGIFPLHADVITEDDTMFGEATIGMLEPNALQIKMVELTNNDNYIWFYYMPGGVSSI